MHSFPSTAQKLLSLFEQGTQQNFAKGQIILGANQIPDGIFYVKEGFIKVYSITHEGNENLHIIYGPDMLFPIVWAVTGNYREVSFEAMEEAKVCRLSRDTFLEALKTDVEMSNAVLSRMVDLVTIYADRVDNLEHTRSSSRIIYRLLKLAEKSGEPFQNGVLIKVPVRHHDIANSSNCSRETVSREMQQLEKKELISYHQHHIVLKDVQKLQAELLKTTKD